MSTPPKFTKPGADVRREQILDAALVLAIDKGYDRITRDGVATKAEVSQGLVNMYFGDMDGLRSALMKYAVSRGNLKVVAQGLIGGHPEALKAPQSLRSLAAGQVFDA
jgi:AcrR family transcriptional regulator